MLTIRYIETGSNTSIWQHYGLPQKPAEGAKAYTPPQHDELIFAKWFSFKRKKHPDSGATVGSAELMEGGEFNSSYTVVSYGKVVDTTNSREVPQSLIEKYAPYLLEKKEEAGTQSEPSAVTEVVEVEEIVTELPDVAPTTEESATADELPDEHVDG